MAVNHPVSRIALLAILFCSAPAAAQESFFKGKTITIIQEPSPLMPEDHERAIKDVPRDPEVVEIFKKLVGAGPLPAR